MSFCSSVEPKVLHGVCEVIDVVRMKVRQGMPGVEEFILPGPAIILDGIMVVEYSYEDLLSLSMIIETT